MDMFELDLGEFGAPGFTLRDRVDFSGHGRNVAPHINTDLINPGGQVLRYDGTADYRDLCSNQIPGFNGMNWS